MSVSSDAITVPSGTYLITMDVNGTLGTGSTPMTFTLYQNGAAVTGEYVTLTIDDANNVLAGSKSSIVTTTGTTTFSIYNTSTLSATLTNAGLTVIKLA